MTAALQTSSVVVTLEAIDNPDQVIMAIRTIRGVAGVAAYVANASPTVPVVAKPAPPPRPVLKPIDIQLAVARHYRLKLINLIQHDRCKHVAEARHVAMYLCKRRLPGWSLPDIGRAFRRDHTTVMAAIQKIAVLVAAGEARIVESIDSISRLLPPLLEAVPASPKETTT